jgi:hypothetical protein
MAKGLATAPAMLPATKPATGGDILSSRTA